MNKDPGRWHKAPETEREFLGLLRSTLGAMSLNPEGSSNSQVIQEVAESTETPVIAVANMLVSMHDMGLTQPLPTNPLGNSTLTEKGVALHEGFDEIIPELLKKASRSR